MTEDTNGAAEAQATASVTERRSALPVWLIATIAGFFGLFYAYAVWNAVAFLISQATGPLGLNGGGWALFAVPPSKSIHRREFLPAHRGMQDVTGSIVTAIYIVGIIVVGDLCPNFVGHKLRHVQIGAWI